MRKFSIAKSATAFALLATVGAGALQVAPALADSKAPAAVEQSAATPAKDAVATATQSSEDNAILKTVDDAYKAVREVRAARIAIFNGQPDQATSFVTSAQKDFEAAQAAMDTYAIKDKKTPKEGDSYLPFDSSLSLAEGFVPTQDKQETLLKANEHLAKGESRKAAEILKLANVDVTVSAALVPAKTGLAHVSDAAKLIGEKKYYEANLALKAVEDSIVVENYSVDAVPAQG
ncbi:YfdX family protein [Roseibium sp. FZY0029]|uniref:YfdX family protein n=1 Tax=Roseibium sp. FZY0029 TaxID=3116647 RepID=UPI002EB94DBC|nr:YfdX family protein [Roseibium sp. FZY0029]